MLTLAKVELYGRFKGDMDNLSRGGVDPHAVEITDDEWLQLARLRQALSIIQSGLASASLIEETEKTLRSNTADEATRTAIRELRE